MPVVSDVAVETAMGILTCRLRVPHDLPIFTGHFPAMAIVPGALQIGWVVALARANNLVSGELAGIAFAKFRRLVQPGADLQARLEVWRSSEILQFELATGDVVVSRGRLRFSSFR